MDGSVDREAELMGKSIEWVESLYKDRGSRARELKSKGAKVIGYLCTFTPVEIITAAGLISFRITGGGQQSITEANAHLETIACPYTRSIMDVALREGYSFFDGFVMPHACDNIVKLYDLWSQNINHSYGHFVNVPHTLSAPSKRFFEAELNTFKASLEKYTQKQIAPKDLNEAIHKHNQQRALIRQLYDLRKIDPPLLSGSEMIKIIVAALSLPVTESNELLEGVLSEINDRRLDTDEMKRPRLMIHGSGIDNTSFIDLVEEAGAEVVVDDFCFGTRSHSFEIAEDDDPLSALAQGYLEDINCPRTFRQSPGTHREDLENRFGHIYQLAKAFNVKGVISYIMQYCDTHAFDLPDVEEYISGKGLPILKIEEDYPISSEGRLKTRIEAFLETIG